MIQIQAIVLKKNENVQQKIFSKRNRKHFENNTKCYKNKTKCSQEEIVPKQIFNKNLLEQIQNFCSIPNCLELSRLFQKLIQNVLKLFYVFFQNFGNNKKVPNVEQNVLPYRFQIFRLLRSSPFGRSFELFKMFTETKKFSSIPNCLELSRLF